MADRIKEVGQRTSAILQTRLDLIWTRLLRYGEESAINRAQLVLIILMQVALIGGAALSIYEGAWLTLFVCFLGLLISWVPSFLAHSFRVRFPLEFEFILNVFIYGSIYLGTVHDFYTRFWWWDMVLHTGSGVGLAFLGFLLLYSLYRANRLNVSLGLVAVFSFSFGLALGALWEIFEFTLDQWFAFDMQGNGLSDTMWDLIVDALGALVVAVAGYFYIKNQARHRGLFEYLLSVIFEKRFK